MRCFTTPIWRSFAVFALGLFLLPLAGCQGDSSPVKGPKGTVKGKVIYNGSPIPVGCAIVFMHQEKSLPATGSIGADGGYTLQMAGKPEILAGTYKVSVSAPAKATATADASNPDAYKAVMMGKGVKPAEEKPPFPKKYQMAETSGLTFTVKEGPNTIDIEMKDGV
jgi:hypothetical protein